MAARKSFNSNAKGLLALRGRLNIVDRIINTPIIIAAAKEADTGNSRIFIVHNSAEIPRINLERPLKKNIAVAKNKMANIATDCE
jgi:hypothetical protein